MATYYVSTTGNDGNVGNITFPFRTVSKGTSVLVVGDTLLFRGGTYPGNGFGNAIPRGPAGTAGNFTLISAYNGEPAVIQPPNTNFRVVELYGNGKAYIEFKDLT